jgi:hypothetical protein
MTRQEFENHPDPLVMIVSINPETGKTLHDTYDWDAAEGWMQDFEKDFPDMLHFRTTNKAGIKRRRECLGF